MMLKRKVKNTAKALASYRPTATALSPVGGSRFSLLQKLKTSLSEIITGISVERSANSLLPFCYRTR